jgi:hypothetical protein
VSWADLGAEIVVSVGDNGGRWELEREPEDVAFVEELVRAAIAGRLTEEVAPGRSRVEVTLSDGSSKAETGYTGLSGCLPMPFWTRWSRKVQYLPYR